MNEGEFSRYCSESFSRFVENAARYSGDSTVEVQNRIGAPPSKPHKDDVWRVIELNGQVVGYFWVRLFPEKKTAFGYDIILFEGFRGSGFGRRVMTQTMNELKSLGIESLQLCVFIDNEVALSLYKSLGFRELSRNSQKKQLTMGYRY